MRERTDIGGPHPIEVPRELSLVLGGPLYQLWRRTRLADDGFHLLHRRVIVLAMLAWGPLLVLSIASGQAWASAVKLPFLYDIEMHVRLLLALPLLVIAELVVHQRMRPVVGQFLARRLIPADARAKFDEAIDSAMRLRNSIVAEVLLIALVYGVGVLVVWRNEVALDVSSWYGSGIKGELHPTPAGWWMGLVSLPLFQFLFLRWYFRLFIWGRFLWQVSRIKLDLMPMNPDRCGGLGFLASTSQAFSPILFAQGAVLAGMMANRIFYTGARLPQFQLELTGIAGIMVLAVLGPLLVFFPMLAEVKRAALREYGTLAQRYAREFDHKWLRGGAPADEALIGSADIQSLADLGNSFQVVQEMRMVPFTMKTMVQLAVTTLLPVAPLLLTMIPLVDLLNRLLKIVF